MESLEDLRLFLEVSRAKSFSQAGRKMGLSPSAVSRRIAALEDSLGVQLLRRTTRQLAMTEAGDFLQRRAELLLGEFEDTRSTLRSFQEQPRGSIKVSTVDILAQCFITPFLPDFFASYPDVNLELILGDAPLDMIDEKIDLAIRVGNPSDSSHIVRKLSDHGMSLAASPAYLEQWGVPQQPQDLTEHNCLTYRDNQNRNLWNFRQGDHEEEIRVQGSLSTNSARVLLNAALGGCGLVLLPSWFLARPMAEGMLSSVLEGYEAGYQFLNDGVVYAMLPPGAIPPKVRVFLDHAIQAFSNKKE